MGIKVITPPATAVIPIAELLTHLKDEGADAARQAELLAMLDAAREYAQHYTGRAWGVQTLELALDAFPCGPIDLPRTPVASITSIKYLDTAGAEQTLASNLYTLDDYNTQQHWAVPAYNTEWPQTLAAANAVKVRFVAGTAALPSAVRSALLLTVGHLDTNRSAVEVTTGSAITVPMAVDALLDTQKVWAL